MTAANDPQRQSWLNEWTLSLAHDALRKGHTGGLDVKQLVGRIYEALDQTFPSDYGEITGFGRENALDEGLINRMNAAESTVNYQERALADYEPEQQVFDGRGRDPRHHGPAVDPAESVADNYIVCLEDGKKLKMLTRYLKARYGLSPDEYRRKWQLPPDYPMVAPNHSKRRSQIAHTTGLADYHRRPRADA